MTRIAILLSGRGSNFIALADAMEGGAIPAEICLVVSNLAGAAGIGEARRRGLATAEVPHRGLKRRDHEQQVLTRLEEAGTEWICLAGYMRKLSPQFVARYPHRILNIHPSLLPAFPGLHVHEQVLDHGAKVSGCTVHLVDEGLDSGPIVVQRAVAVEDDDSAQSLAARVLEQEHLAYPAALRRLLTQSWRLDGRRVVFS